MQGEKGVDIKATSRQARRFYYDLSGLHGGVKTLGVKKGTTNISVVVPLPKLKKIEKT